MDFGSTLYFENGRACKIPCISRACNTSFFSLLLLRRHVGHTRSTGLRTASFHSVMRANESFNIIKISIANNQADL